MDMPLSVILRFLVFVLASVGFSEFSVTRVGSSDSRGRLVDCGCCDSRDALGGETGRFSSRHSISRSSTGVNSGNVFELICADMDKVFN